MRARAEIVVGGRISEAEQLWYDTSRWSTFVDGFHHVASVDPEWPARGALVWDSTPDGRGRVIETVATHEPRVGQTVLVEDAKLDGTQTVAFAALERERVRVRLALSYKLKDRPLGPLTPVLDALFIRPRQREALARTLIRFSRELAAERAALGDA